jgi:hypothetical protein
MSLWLILLVTALYCITALLQTLQGSYGFGLMWFAYALANVGIMMAGGTK